MRKHYRDLTPSVPHPRLPHPRDHVRRAVHPPDPERNAGGGHPRRDVEGRAWPGQQEINFRYDNAVTMADNHVIYKNGAKEIAHLNGCSITFMAKPRPHVDRELLPHPLEPVARRRERLRRRVRPFQALPGGPNRLHEGARCLCRADDQLVQALRGGQLGADDARVGPRQPHVRLRIVGHGALLGPR